MVYDRRVRSGQLWRVVFGDADVCLFVVINVKLDSMHDRGVTTYDTWEDGETNIAIEPWYDGCVPPDDDIESFTLVSDVDDKRENEENKR